MDRVSLKRKGGRRALSATALDLLVKGWSVNPAVFKCYVALPPPSAEDNLNDFGRLARELKKTCATGEVSANLNVLKSLSDLVRKG